MNSISISYDPAFRFYELVYIFFNELIGMNKRIYFTTSVNEKSEQQLS